MRMLLPATGTPMGVWQGGIATEYSTSLPLKSDRRWYFLPVFFFLFLFVILLFRSTEAVSQKKKVALVGYF